MSTYSRIARELAESEWGPMASVRSTYVDRRPVIIVTAPTADGGESIVAIAGGEDASAAWPMLLRLLVREDRSLSTQEAAAVLGIHPDAVSKAVQRGRLTPLERGIGTAPSRFSPAELHSYLGFHRRRGQAEALAEAE